MITAVIGAETLPAVGAKVAVVAGAVVSRDCHCRSRRRRRIPICSGYKAVVRALARVALSAS